MTTLDTNRSGAASTGILAGIASLFSTLASWNDARITRKSLSRLSARELEDIGLCRGDIDAIATRGAQL